MVISKELKKKDFNKINPLISLRARKIHFIGIGGIGLSAIAKLMNAQGKIISGSDANRSEITDELEKIGVSIFIGQKAENLADDVELVIYTLAIPASNPERAKAEKNKIPMLTYPEALGILFNDKYGIAICGTHGKSTTTSMTSLVLADGGLDPSVVVGSKVPAFARFSSKESKRGENLRIGRSNYFVIEACEYERAFLNYYPKIAVLNNIELDHTDYYKDIDDYRNAFEKFIGHLPEGGVLILNGDDAEVSNLIRQWADSPKRRELKKISFGFGEKNNVRGYDVRVEEGKTKFKVNYNGNKLGLPREIPRSGNFAFGEIISLGEFIIRLPGKFNVYNALAAIAVGLNLGVDIKKIKKVLAEFGGIWRRFEIKGEYKGAIVISDYAHHPTAVKSTIEAAKEFYQGKRVVAVFQPHQHNRTKMLYQDFLKSFDSADILVLVKIFDVAGREEKKDQNVSSEGLAEDIKKINKKMEPNIFYAKNLKETRKLIDDKIKSDDILLIMGAGDIYKVADELVE